MTKKDKDKIKAVLINNKQEYGLTQEEVDEILEDIFRALSPTEGKRL